MTSYIDDLVRKHFPGQPPRQEKPEVNETYCTGLSRYQICRKALQRAYDRHRKCAQLLPTYLPEPPIHQEYSIIARRLQWLKEWRDIGQEEFDKFKLPPR